MDMKKALQEQGNKTSSVQGLLADLKASIRTRDLQRGRRVHAEAEKSGHDANIYVTSALINMYAKCGCILEAHKVFNRLKHPNVVSWTVLITGYAENGQAQTALYMFRRMQGQGLVPDSSVFVVVLKACLMTIGGAECLKRVKEIHNLIVENGCSSNTYCQSTLIDMYASCNSMRDARHVFSCIKHPEVVSWNALILGYADNGRGYVALLLFTRMKRSRIAPDSVTFVAVLKACTALATTGAECTDRGCGIHNLAVENGCDAESKVHTTLINMYVKCCSMIKARHEFESMKHADVVSCNVLLLGYADTGQGFAALSLFSRIRCQDLAPESASFVAALKACTSLAMKDAASECKNPGAEIHDLAIEQGYDSVLEVQNTLIDMYCKCGSVVDALLVFNTMKIRDVVSWTALILGYANNRQGLTALNLFMRMRTEGPAPNSVTFMASLKACSLVGALELGRDVHSELERACDLDVVLVTCLVDFYAKCGSLVEAQGVFDLHPATRNIRTWTALLTGFSHCGNPDSVFPLFERMQDAGLLPSSVTVLCILTCCSHAGLAEKGKECFDTMSMKYGIAPSLEHYSCMVNILGRSNRLDDAMALLRSMPCSPNDVTWTSVLCACRQWKNLEIGRLAFQSLMKLDGAACVLMGQIYATRRMLQEQEMVIRMNPKPGEVPLI